MKKNYFILVLTFLMTILLVGCGKSPTLVLTNLDIKLTAGEKYTIEYVIENEKGQETVVAKCDSDIIKIDGLMIEALKVGTADVEVMIEGKNKTKQILKVTVLADEEVPQILVDTELTKQNVQISYNSLFDPMYGIKAVDNIDGDITSKVTVKGTVNTKALGDYSLEYTVKDKYGNLSKPLNRIITVVWDSSVTFIGHAGCYSGLMNSKEAFQNAFTLHGYQGIECDVKQTRDGVFVTSHNDDFKGIQLNQVDWKDIKDVELTQSRGGVSYTTKLCTFRDYLKIAKANNGFCVVELKYSNGINNNDQSRMPALMEEIKEEGMLNNVIFLASQYKCLEWVRDHGYDYIPCQYLVSSINNPDTLEYCKQHNFDISFNIANDNDPINIARYHEAGLKVACYTFSQYTTASDLQHWIDLDVDFVTVDKTRPYEVKLPAKFDENTPKFKVTFKDYDGKLLKTVEVYQGKGAAAPYKPERKGYEFIGWDKEINNIQGPLEVKAKYARIDYTINYEKNNITYAPKEFESKQAFIDELYTDWFNWLDKSVGTIEGLTKTDGTYKLAMNGQTATWTDVTSLKQIDKYVFEKTIGALAYKPVESRPTPTTPVEPKVDNGYFLNTEPYRKKYINMDKYLIDCIASNYPGYSNTFTPTGSGKVQIFFRFHQWQQGTNIAPFNNIPIKNEPTILENLKIKLPTTHKTYNIDDEFDLPEASCEGMIFTGWYLDPECTKPITKITKGSTGNIALYAGWKAQ